MSDVFIQQSVVEPSKSKKIPLPNKLSNKRIDDLMKEKMVAGLETAVSEKNK